MLLLLLPLAALLPYFCSHTVCFLLLLSLFALVIFVVVAQIGSLPAMPAVPAALHLLTQALIKVLEAVPGAAR